MILLFTFLSLWGTADEGGSHRALLRLVHRSTAPPDDRGVARRAFCGGFLVHTLASVIVRQCSLVLGLPAFCLPCLTKSFHDQLSFNRSLIQQTFIEPFIC